MKAIVITQLSLIAIIVVGWVMNIISLVGLGLDQALTVEGVLRIVGIPLAPLGAVMGYFV